MPITLNEEQKEEFRSFLEDYVFEALDSPFEICEKYPLLLEFLDYVGYITEEDMKAYKQLKDAKAHLEAKYGGDW